MNKKAPYLVKLLNKIMQFFWNLAWKYKYQGKKITIDNFYVTNDQTIYGTLTVDAYCYWLINLTEINNFIVSKQSDFVIPQKHKIFFDDIKIVVYDKVVKESEIK